MLFKNSEERIAKKLFSQATDMIMRLINDPELKMNHPDSTSIIFSAYLFMIAGFLGEGDISEEMFPVYQRFLVEKGASKNSYDYMSELVQMNYSKIRETMIEAQDELGSNVDALIFALADTICTLTETENKLIGTGIVKDYLLFYLDKASRSIHRSSLYAGDCKKKKAKPIMIIGVVMIVLNCVALIADPTIIPDVLRYTGNLISLLGVFWLILLGLVLVLIYTVINRKR